MRRRVAVVAAGLAAMILVGCGASSDVAQPSRTVPPGTLVGATTVPTTVPVTYACTPDPDPLTVDAGKPEVAIPEGDAPTELQTTDLVVGEGPAAAIGDQLQLQYVGVLHKDGAEFDSSWSREATPIPVTLGEGGVIPGWDQGLVGMQLGGRRMLVIPPDLAYGANGSPPDIGPNETLVFVVDLVQLCTPEASPDASVPDSTTGTDVVPTDTSVAGETTTTVATESTTTTTAAATSSTTAAP